MFREVTSNVPLKVPQISFPYLPKFSFYKIKFSSFWKKNSQNKVE